LYIIYKLVINYEIRIIRNNANIYQLILSENLSSIYQNNIYNLIVENKKELGIIFNSNSEVNLMPNHLKKYIKNYYNHFDEILTDYYLLVKDLK
jgi:hypothetical protein